MMASYQEQVTLVYTTHGCTITGTNHETDRQKERKFFWQTFVDPLLSPILVSNQKSCDKLAQYYEARSKAPGDH